MTIHTTMSAEELFEACKPRLTLLEETRKAKLRTYLWRKKVGSAVASVLIPSLAFLDYLLLQWQSGNDDQAAGLSILAAAAIWHWVTSPKRQYVKAYKKDIMPKLAHLFAGLNYEAGGKIPMGELILSKLIPSHDKYNSEDYFSGDYKGVYMQFAEIKLTKKKGSGKNKRTVTMFKGLAILLRTTNKKFYGHTIIHKDQSKAKEWLKEKSLDLKRANLVDPEFEKMFDVYTNDQVEARYLIDPIMIESLKSLYQRYNGKNMSVAYYRDKMLIMIASTKNHFEPPALDIPAITPETVYTLRKEIENILSIIDQLSLYDEKRAREIHE
jgi:hypothetical protein